jgi:DNA-directed RNA polymerase specialized sigma24 family protein
MIPDDSPSTERLRSADESVSSREWGKAYPLLYEAGARIAAMRLSGSRWAQDREDLVSVALHQLVKGLVENTLNSFKLISSWDDCLAMMRSIVRLRIVDFHRERGRDLEDAVAELPEPVAIFQAVVPGLGSEDIFHEIDRLDPPLPELFRERFVEGYTIDEIATKRGMNRNTLCTWFADALKILRHRLSDNEGEGAKS